MEQEARRQRAATASPVPILQRPYFYDAQRIAAAVATVCQAAGANGGGGETQPQQPRGPNWGAPSVTHGGQQQQQSSLSATAPSTTTADVMSLDSIRSTLIRQEDSIIFALIERAQFRRNDAIYAKGILQLDPGVPDHAFLKTLSFLEYLLLETEKLHGRGG